MFHNQEVRSEISLGADVDDEAADRIDPGTVAGVEHDRRRDFLDDRRPGDLIDGEQRLAMPDRRRVPAAAARSLCLEIDPARSVACFLRRLAPAGGPPRQFGW